MTKRIISVLIAVVLVALLPVEALAVSRIDPGREVGLEILYQDNGTPIAGAEFEIYLIATVDSCGNLTPTETFAGYNIDFSNHMEDDWRAIASTLEGYILRDDISPTDYGTTDSEGRLAFPNHEEELEQGLYLVLGSRYIQGQYIYEVQSFLVMLPTLDQMSDDWCYDVTVKPKFDKDLIPEGDEEDTVKRKVLKIWKDEGHEHERPGEIVVELLRDGEVYDTVILNAENNWRYTWEDLDADHHWVVVEKIPEGYTVVVTRVGVTFVIINSYEEPPTTEPTEPTEPTTPTEPTEPTTPTEPTEPTTPTEPTEPTGSTEPTESTGPTEPTEPTTPTEPTEPTGPTEPSGPTEPTEPELPQTGQLWWPVPVLFAAGLFLIVMGLLRRRGDGYEG